MSIKAYEAVFSAPVRAIAGAEFTLKVDGDTKYSKLNGAQAEFYLAGMNMGHGHVCTLYRGPDLVARKDEHGTERFVRPVRAPTKHKQKLR